MKGIVIIFFLVLSYLSCIAQYANDNWLAGYYNSIVLKFKNDSIKDALYPTDNIKYDCGHSNINDKEKPLFSCNGFSIINSDGNIMENGYHILPSKYPNYANNISSASQESIILPKKDKQFYVFAWGISDIVFDSMQNGQIGTRFDILTYSIVDLSYNNGLGKVVSKENYLLQNADLSGGQMVATRHANGRDWWLVKPHKRKHGFYTFLVTPDGITSQPYQEFDSPSVIGTIYSHSNFSPDGSLFVFTDEQNPSKTTQVNTFNRCTGRMEKFKTIAWKFDSTYQEWSVKVTACISPNNRFVYLINNVSIIQYDLINDEQIELVQDTFTNFCNFFKSYNGPDGKIYIGNFQPNCKTLTYIEFPDKKGLDAHFCYACYTSSYTGIISPPNNPNYELGALLGSPCDTIGKIYSDQVEVFPNPVQEEVTVFAPFQAGTMLQIRLVNAMGEVILQSSKVLDDKQKTTLDLNHLANGVYFLKLNVADRNFVKRIIKI